MKKILTSLVAAGALGVLVFAATSSFFSDTETSTGNKFEAGSIDLKIDHARATYNDVDCNTCSVLLISDPTNMVVAKDGVPIPTPYPAVYVSWIHPAWTAQNDTDLVAAGAQWIWESDPTRQEDTTVDVTYTFQKTFDWWGPITGSDLTMAVGHDNTVEVWLNGVMIGSSSDVYGYRIENMLHIPGATITSQIVQGQNVLEVKLTNKAEPDGNPQINPAGLIYKFEIDGNCEDNYFKQTCELWALKDLNSEDLFWNFSDLKPGDRGSNVISYHVFDNDAYMCTFLTKEDLENVIVEPEFPPDVTDPLGELSNYLEVFVWNDVDGDGNYETGETQIANDLLANLNVIPVAEPTTPVIGSTDNYLGIAWCFGDLTANIDGAFGCDGTADMNDAQTDTLNLTLEFYAEQARNNDTFSCQAIFDKNLED